MYPYAVRHMGLKEGMSRDIGGLQIAFSDGAVLGTGALLVVPAKRRWLADCWLTVQDCSAPSTQEDVIGSWVKWE
jgi:hypothetical protein